MKKSLGRFFFVIFIVVFILLQMLVWFNTSLLMGDLDSGIKCNSWDLSKPKYVNILIKTCKDYGEFKNANESTLYYILGAIILLVLFIFSTKKDNEIREIKTNNKDNGINPGSDKASEGGGQSGVN